MNTNFETHRPIEKKKQPNYTLRRLGAAILIAIPSFAAIKAFESSPEPTVEHTYEAVYKSGDGGIEVFNRMVEENEITLSDKTSSVIEGQKLQQSIDGVPQPNNRVIAEQMSDNSWRFTQQEADQ